MNLLLLLALAGTAGGLYIARRRRKSQENWQQNQVQTMMHSMLQTQDFLNASSLEARKTLIRAALAVSQNPQILDYDSLISADVYEPDDDTRETYS